MGISGIESEVARQVMKEKAGIWVDIPLICIASYPTNIEIQYGSRRGVIDLTRRLLLP
jgi:hypothetical protein